MGTNRKFLADKTYENMQRIYNENSTPGFFRTLLDPKGESRRAEKRHKAEELLSRQKDFEEQVKFQKNKAKLTAAGVPEEEATALAYKVAEKNVYGDDEFRINGRTLNQNMGQAYGGDFNTPGGDLLIAKAINARKSAERDAKNEEIKKRNADAVKRDEEYRKNLEQDRAKNLDEIKANAQKRVEENRKKLKENSYRAKRDDTDSEYGRTLKRRAEELAGRAEELAGKAASLGYSGVTADSIIEKAKQRLGKRVANEESRLIMAGDEKKMAARREELSMMNELGELEGMEADLYKNANKKVIGERGKQMTADLKAREDAIRNNPNAAKRREALSREWNGRGNPSFAQADARARWKAEANAGRYGNRRNIGRDMEAYVGSSKHGFDTLDNLNKGWGGNAPRSLIPTGSAADNFAKAYEFNQNYMKTQQDMMQAQLAQQQKLANQIMTVLNNTPPNSPKETNLNNAQVAAKAGATTPQPEPIKG